MSKILAIFRWIAFIPAGVLLGFLAVVFSRYFVPNTFGILEYICDSIAFFVGFSVACFYIIPVPENKREKKTAQIIFWYSLILVVLGILGIAFLIYIKDFSEISKYIFRGVGNFIVCLTSYSFVKKTNHNNKSIKGKNL